MHSVSKRENGEEQLREQVEPACRNKDYAKTHRKEKKKKEKRKKQ